MEFDFSFTDTYNEETDTLFNVELWNGCAIFPEYMRALVSASDKKTASDKVEKAVLENLHTEWFAISLEKVS